jgi:hypothetical protein
MIYIVWSSATGPIACYEDPNLAYAHARTMVGVEVAALPIARSVPEIVREDMTSEYDGDEDTPVVELGNIDDASEPDK